MGFKYIYLRVVNYTKQAWVKLLREKISVKIFLISRKFPNVWIYAVFDKCVLWVVIFLPPSLEDRSMLRYFTCSNYNLCSWNKLWGLKLYFGIEIGHFVYDQLSLIGPDLFCHVMWRKYIQLVGFSVLC